MESEDAESKRKHGGKRNGAGRPRKHFEPTIRKHVPASLGPDFDEWLSERMQDGVRRVCKATGESGPIAGKVGAKIQKTQTDGGDKP